VKQLLAALLLAVSFAAMGPGVVRNEAELRCEAYAVKREAGGESLKGQRAVLDVIRNRMYQYNLLACQVIAQPGQFSFYDASKRMQLTTKDLTRYYVVARMPTVLAKATYFHTVDVEPPWAERFQRVAVIGNHVFYKEK
jgi:N-acetylmuramoyl-L-alanine amidase